VRNDRLDVQDRKRIGVAAAISSLAKFLPDSAPAGQGHLFPLNEYWATMALTVTTRTTTAPYGACTVTDECGGLLLERTSPHGGPAPLVLRGCEPPDVGSHERVYGVEDQLLLPGHTVAELLIITQAGHQPLLYQTRLRTGSRADGPD